jgi:F0F1-type ATP synthase membrane subunit c/vacuolar-type H+-ATPase subunit K
LGLGLGFGDGGGGGGIGNVLGASISAILDKLLLEKNLNRFTIFRYIGAGLAAGFGILGTSIGGGIMVSRGLEAIGRNPFAKSKLQFNLYASLVGFILAASLAVVASYLILQ